MILNPTITGGPAVEQATPSIEVSPAGLITATATQAAGSVEAGTKSATKQLATQAGTTITPGATQKTAVASGKYTTGDVVVAGDPELVPGNIKQGVNIFGVTGTMSAGVGTVTMTVRANGTAKAFYTLSNGMLMRDSISAGFSGQIYVSKGSIVVIDTNRSRGDVFVSDEALKLTTSLGGMSFLGAAILGATKDFTVEIY